MSVACISCVFKALIKRDTYLFKHALSVNGNLSCSLPKVLLAPNLKTVWNTSALGVLNLLHTTTASRLFWESDPRSGYPSTVKMPSKVQLIRDGIKELKKEVQLWKKEMKDHLECDPIFVYNPDEVDILWQFGPPESLTQWVTGSDSDHNQGFSNCDLILSKTGKGIFQGNICVEPPKDGKVKRAGYCSMRTIRARKSFKRETYHDWSMYTHLVMKVRGDGRPYIVNISSMGYFDQLWNDVYTYALYTRGGPYWQITKIPFSKFFLGSKGRIQDRQSAVPLNRVSHFGIAIGDKVNGPFRLEIDYIGLEFDPGHIETFAYETYRVPNYVAST